MSDGNASAAGPDTGAARLAAAGLSCPAPAPEGDRILLGHGSGGKLSAALIRDRFLPRFSNPALAALGDGAIVGLGRERFAISTDTFVVSPLEFPGGDIGLLAVHGTLNDVAMMGAEAVCLTAGFVLEEGLPLELLDRVLGSMAEATGRAGVPLVTGDTKVVERGKADGLYINTTGIGRVREDFQPAPDRARAGDVVLVSGPIGRHGIAVMSAREGLGFAVEVESDTANLGPIADGLRAACGNAVRTLRDPTRGGVASALNEIAAASRKGISLNGEDVPVPDSVNAACEVLGLDPLYVANEGVMIAIVEPEAEQAALEAMRADPAGTGAARIGIVQEGPAGMVTLRTGFGGNRVVDMLPGDQLPRIC